MDKEHRFIMNYYTTYYFANVINNILHDQISYLRKLDSFFGDSQYSKFLEGFPKYSALHSFIDFTIDVLNDENISEIEIDSFIKQEHKNLWLNNALQYHNIEHISFTDWLTRKGISIEDITHDEFYYYYQDLWDINMEFKEQLIEEVFFILFINRDLLKQFNELISSYICDKTLDEIYPEERKYFAKDGILKRVNIPAWVRKAVFYRDRGCCVFCNKDISGLVNIQNQSNFDHIVPLARGGINDVTNIQLLCESCNSSKKDHNTETSTYYYRWF